MKNAMILFIVLMLYSTILLAQSISPQVIASNGMFSVAGGSSLSYTIGEPATTTLGTNSSIITQGFQQPNNFYIPTGLQSIHSSPLNAQLYPNPASTEVNLVITAPNTGTYTVELVDLLGHVIQKPLTTEIANGKIRYVFNVQQLSSSMYFITIKENSNPVVYSLKLNKIN